MLHELLLALYGVPGAIYVPSASLKTPDETKIPTDETTLVPIADHLPYLSQGELSLHKELLQMGSSYNYLERFIRQHAGLCPSLYLSALACGFDDALDSYRQALVTLESELLENAELNVSHFIYRLHPYKFLLPIMANVAQKVESIIQRSKSENVLGCRLLDVLISSAPSGLPGPRSVFRKLITRVLRVFYRQLSSWMIHGVLHDPYAEFFVCCHESGRGKSGDDGAHTDGSRDSMFTLSVDRIPAFLPASFAEHVLFTGEAINLITEDASKLSLIEELERLFASNFTALSNTTEDETTVDMISLVNLKPIQSLVSEIRAFVSRRVWHTLIQQHDLLAYLRSAKDVALLGRGELFHAFIDQLCVLNETDRPGFDQSDRLTMTTSTVHRARSLLDKQPPTDPTELKAMEYDIQAAFLAAARSIGMDDEELGRRFRFVLTPSVIDSDSAMGDGDGVTAWDHLHLELIVPPALRMVFSHHACRGYDRLFRYLAAIRRTQLVLQQLWAEQTLLWRRSAQSSPRTRSVGKQQRGRFDPFLTDLDRRLLSRNRMAFVVENLQYYLQVDVIDSQFSHLLHRIETDQEAHLILAAHEAYLAGLQAQTLLFHPTAKPCILRLLTICQQFVRASTSFVIPDSPIANKETSQVELEREDERLATDFGKMSLALFHCLNSSQSSGAKSCVGLDTGIKQFGQARTLPRVDLSQLLLRLDFNQFYSQSHAVAPHRDV